MTSFYYERRTVARKNNVKTAAKLKVKFSSYVFGIALLPPFNKTITTEKGKKKDRLKCLSLPHTGHSPEILTAWGFISCFCILFITKASLGKLWS